mmetsp:Transcript_10693/g.30489  ORF Transcript_10693/g.30489 Transcript_10693/m.30489 type:complete len:152 (+) Transcript_10693:163-618(+)
MSVVRSVYLRIFILVLLVAQTLSFTLQPRSTNVITRIQQVSSNLPTSRRVSKRRGLFMTTEGQEEAESVEVAVGDNDDDDDGVDRKKGITKTVLLTVPLFCKFVIVLLIKFATDLVLYPLLFLYRLLRAAKRSVFAKIGSFKKTDKVNGEH